MTRAVRLVAWFASLGAAAWCLQRATAFGLDVPSPGLASWRTWIASEQPQVVVMSLVRVATLAIVWYLIAASVLATMATLTRSPSLARAARATSTASLRRALQLTVAGSLSVTVPAAAAGADDLDAPPVLRLAPSDAPPPQLVRLPSPADDAAGSPASTLLPSTTTAVSNLEPVASDGPVASPSPTTTTIGSPANDDAMPSGGGTYVVRPGDSFWSIAAAQLSAETGRAPSDAAVTERSASLVAANQHRLIVPDDPDLLVPGQELVLV